MMSPGVTQPIDYIADDPTQPRPRRSAAMWVKLLIVWCAGLLVWTFYIALILYAFFRVMM